MALVSTGILSLLCGMSLFWVMTIAVIAKIRHHREFIQSLDSVGFIPAAWLAPLALAVIAAEGVATFCLLLGLGAAGFLSTESRFFSVTGYSLLIFLFSVFTIVLTTLLLKKKPFSCHCFGNSGHKVSAVDLFRNLLLILMAVVALYLPSALQFSQPGHLFLLVFSAIIALLLVHLPDIVFILTYKVPSMEV